MCGFELPLYVYLQLDGEIAVKVLGGLVSGLMFLHEAKPPILHTDLKSANVLVSENFVAKLTDICGHTPRKGKLLGTPFWMAPELFAEVRIMRTYAIGELKARA